jgi:thymidine kinase
MAHVEIIMGSMFSGKSTELMRRCRTYTAINKQVCLINHSYDTRSARELKTHDNVTMQAIKTTQLCTLPIDPEVDIVAIDEAQFFDDLYDFILLNETKKNLVILISGLDGDSSRNPFGQIFKCIPLCDSVTKLYAMCSECKDGTPGIFSKRLAASTDQVCIGASNQFISVCRRHYLMK